MEGLVEDDPLIGPVPQVAPWGARDGKVALVRVEVEELEEEVPALAIVEQEGVCLLYTSDAADE